jgi:hypothetical protein
MPSIRPINVIASQRVGAKRRPMTGSAKQSILSSRGKMDCFAALAMTAECDFAFSRHDLPEVLQENLALEIRGRREDRVRAAPAVSRAMVDSGRTRAYRFGGNTPAFPAQRLYGLYEFAPVTGFLATVIPGSFRSRET